jgi:hypothetical protein
LLRALKALPRQKDVLSGLAPRSKTDLKNVLSGVTDKDRDALADAQGPLARDRPLLHLAVGGRSADAVYLLISTSRLGDELMAYRRLAQSSDFSDVVESIRTVSTAAATSWLHDRATEVSSPVTLTPELLDQIDLAAFAIDRADIARLARSILVELEPKNPRRWLALAAQAARDLDLVEAKKAIAEARALNKTDRVTVSHLANAERLRASAEAASGAAGSVEGALAVARANLEISRPKRALEVLTPHRALSERHLGVATTLALAELGGTVCPGLSGGVANTTLCGLAWDAHPSSAKLVAMIERAWKSGAGRDAGGVESYLGLVAVVPWMYGLTRMSADPAAQQAEVLKRLGTLAEAAREAAKVAPTLEGLVIFIDTLNAGFTALSKSRDSGESVKVPPDVSAKLREHALALGKKTHADRFTQAAVVAVSAMLFRDEDVRPLLELISSEEIEVSHIIPFNVVRLWSAVVARRSDWAAEASGELAGILPELTGARQAERAEIVLLLAEVEAAIGGTPKAYEVLEQVAKPLAEALDAPPELRLRASLDVAGARAKQGRMSEAADVLARVTTSIPWASAPDNSDAQNLGMLATAYLFSIQARITKGDERAEYKDKLAEVGKRASALKVTAASRLWIEMWEKEIEFLVASDRCGAVKVCVDRAKKNRKIPEAEAKRRAGAIAAKLVAEGALPVGTLNLSFGYGSSLHLDALIRVAPMILAVESPGK